MCHVVGVPAAPGHIQHATNINKIKQHTHKHHQHHQPPRRQRQDVALQLLGNLFEYFLAKRKGQQDARLTILGATSGDTGECRACGCWRGGGGAPSVPINLIMHTHKQEQKHRNNNNAMPPGSAAIEGLRGKKNVQLFILYPKGRVSDVQERQMTTVGAFF